MQKSNLGPTKQNSVTTLFLTKHFFFHRVFFSGGLILRSPYFVGNIGTAGVTVGVHLFFPPLSQAIL